MRAVFSPTLSDAQMHGSIAFRLRRSVRDAHRRVFCYSLALSPERSAQSSGPSRAVRLAASVPFGELLRQQVRHRPGFRTIRVASLLMGSQAGLDSTGFADAFGTLRYGSLPMDQSPHVELLRLARRIGRPLTDDEIRATGYYLFARHLASIWGDYFGATTDDEFVGMSRNFIDWSFGNAPRLTMHTGGSRFGDEVLVAKVANSSTYQVIDGHHRLAVAIVRGDTTARVHRTWLSTETALQRRLWDRGYGLTRVKVLTQPVAARELSDWPVSKNCVDRLVRIERLAAAELSGVPVRTFLDVGCGYGWYLAELKGRGWRIHGIERDGFGIEMATSFYGLSSDEVTVGEWATAAESLEGDFDVVTCFELGQVLEARAGAEETIRLLRSLDARTGQALVTDCSLGNGALEALEQLVDDVTNFKRVVDLGANQDPQPTRGGTPATRLVALVR